MPDFSNSTNSTKVQEALLNLHKVCMGSGGDFTDVDEVLITQYIFAGYSHRYVDVRIAGQWTFTTNQRISRSALMWLKELKKDAYQPGIGSWVTAQVHLFPKLPAPFESLMKKFNRQRQLQDAKVRRKSSPPSYWHFRGR
ncbi:hypothetical protein J3A64_002719 [Pseudarthrobacter sp. PvP004]|uniref:hypothetical protein n=1 Tax=Pseudarthrobacter sp. PvP004 TaxID=2817850 RepID=UPI001AE69371|nr:hypothetical protein [Pseudarthrobacter sp. PvP004]MBP2267255.1 hypothetical protein [Pseudarthrobacter sp. PvP004]